MQSIQLTRSRWEALLNSVSQAARGQAAQVEATGLGLGGVGAEHLPLTSIGLDLRTGAVILSFEALEHRIEKPRAIFLEQDGSMLYVIELVDGAGVHHIVQFTTALNLPPTSSRPDAVATA